ncbi:MAG: helix-turn-helix domain containing protein, partial [Paracoccaceae bacterium]
MQPTLDRHAPSEIPSWVPTGARHYLDHTEAGLSIRHLARVAGCHASTVLRQVRRIETLRDDPLIDAALCDLAVRHRSRNSKEMSAMTVVPDLPDGETLTHEARRILRRLCETGAVLAVSEGMDKSVVVRADTRTAVVDTAIARALALKTWIACDAPGRISRYRITHAGRVKLADLRAKYDAAQQDSARGGFDAQLREE